MSNVEDLVKVDENETQEQKTETVTAKRRGRGTPRKSEAAAGAAAESSKPAALRPVEQDVFSEQEIERRRDILVSVAVLGQLKDYVGEDIPPAKIRTMTVERLNAMFTVYQAKLGQESTFDTMDAVVGAAVEGLPFFMTFDDNEALKKDLLKNKGLQQFLGKQAAGVSEKYGDFVAFGRIFFDVLKHIKFPEGGPPAPSDEGAGTPQEEEKEN